MPGIAVIDYEMGNLRSVQKALESVGASAVITRDPRVIADAAAAVLPGVGAFGVCMENLRRHDLISPVKDFIASGRPFLGICLGMQLLFDESEEFGPVRGLGVLPGRVVRFPDDPAGLRKVPHMGWNALQILRRAPHLDGLEDGTQVYFVHSYYPVPEDPRVIATTTNYGGDFVSSVWLANVFACQFHPEKSQAAGLRILANFAALTGEVETRVGAAGEPGSFMLVIPAIDLKDGRCVRLVRGDMTQATVYAEDPVAVARGFEAAGAEWIHVVDLDGAIRGAPVNADAIGAVCRAVRARVEVGGGVRDLATLERVFAAGAGRVVLGTAALEDPDFFAELRRHPGAILAGIDARAGKVAVAGWLRDSATDAAALAARVAAAGAAGIVFTDIARDGTGGGVNTVAVDTLAAAVTLPVIASGGVASLEDVRALRALRRPNLTAVIVGRALYTGAVDLATALRVGRGADG